MFGYVRVNSPELKVKEYEFYRGTYCGLCRSMGKCTGQCSRMALSYDFAFLALVRITFLREAVAFEQKRCIAHPFKKRNAMKHTPSLAYCAGAAALLNYHKVRDDLADERGFKKLRALLLLPFMAHSRKKALKAGLGALDDQIAAGLLALAEAEKSGVTSVDVPAALFGNILGDIMSFGLEGTEARVATALGRTIGRWIYIADALDDWEEDAQKGRYNPFLTLYSGKLPTENELESIRAALKNELYEAEAAMDLIEFENTDIKNIVLNILYLGMPDRIEQIKPGDSSCKKNCKKSGKCAKRKKGRIPHERSV